MWLLVLVTLSATLAIHMFVPALPEAAADLGTDEATMRGTISVYVLSLAVGQLIYGPLADRFGRRPVLLGGLLIYSVTSLAAALAPTADFLIWTRVFQALGGCAGLVLGRAIVRDFAGASDAARRLATLNTLIMIGPGLAPAAGTLVALLLGWRWIFGLLSMAALLGVFLCWRWMPETHAAPGRLDARTLVRSYWALVRSPTFLAFALCGGLVTTSMFAFVSSIAVVTQQLGRPNYEGGLYLGIVIAGVSVGAQLTRRLLARFDMRAILSWSSLLSLAAAASYVGLALGFGLTVPGMLVTMLGFSIGAGIASPIALTITVNLDPRLIGSASGLYGFFQMGVGATCTWLAGFGEDRVLAAGVVLLGAGLTAQLCYRIGVWTETR